jgi:hypothetical protein
MSASTELAHGPAWDDTVAHDLLGSIVIVGITYVDPEGVPESQAQYYGLVTTADKTQGILIECHGVWAGELCGLPPETAAFQKAASGTYRLRSTGEEVVDPDYLSSWTIKRPAKD